MYRVNFAQTDVTSWTSLVAAFKQCISHSPDQAVDLVIACAGMQGPPLLADTPFAGSPEEDPQPPSLRTLDVNLIGAMYTAYLTIHYFRLQIPTDRIAHAAKQQLIIVASGIGYDPIPFFSVYSASKAGIRAF